MSLRCTVKNRAASQLPTTYISRCMEFRLLVYHPRFEPVDFADLCAGRLKNSNMPLRHHCIEIISRKNLDNSTKFTISTRLMRM